MYKRHRFANANDLEGLGLLGRLKFTGYSIEKIRLTLKAAGWEIKVHKTNNSQKDAAPADEGYTEYDS